MNGETVGHYRILKKLWRWWHGRRLAFRPLALLGAARAHAALGDTDAARVAYQNTLAAWSDAEANFEPALEAKHELASLGS